MIGTAEGAARRLLTKGNEAICLGAIAAGCRHYYGYPITPQNDIPEYMAAQLPAIGGTFLQTARCQTMFTEPGQRLAAQDHVHAERAPLTHKTIKQERCLTRDLVVLGEELLEAADRELSGAALSERRRAFLYEGAPLASQSAPSLPKRMASGSVPAGSGSLRRNLPAASNT